jgi:hypothetical protein
MEMERYVEENILFINVNKLNIFVYLIDSEARILFLADPQIEGDAKIFRQGKRGEYERNGFYLDKMTNSPII